MSVLVRRGYIGRVQRAGGVRGALPLAGGGAVAGAALGGAAAHGAAPAARAAAAARRRPTAGAYTLLITFRLCKLIKNHGHLWVPEKICFSNMSAKLSWRDNNMFYHIQTILSSLI